MMDRLVKTGKNSGMEINIDKSKVMRISRKEGPLRIVVGNADQFM